MRKVTRKRKKLGQFRRFGKIPVWGAWCDFVPFELNCITYLITLL